MSSREPAATRIPMDMVIVGGLNATEDVIIEGRFDGYLTLPEHALTIGTSAVVSARIVARSVTIFGSVHGNIIARERVDILPSASVHGHLTTPIIRVLEGAQFTGSVDPHRSEAAVRVAQYRERRAPAGAEHQRAPVETSRRL